MNLGIKSPESWMVVKEDANGVSLIDGRQPIRRLLTDIEYGNAGEERIKIP